MKLKIILTLVFCSIIGFVFQNFFIADFPYTHDGENHLARFANYVVALKEGQFPPRFAPNLFNGYGYPVFNYNYPLANILSVPFSATGLSYESTFKILVFISLLAGANGAFAYLSSIDLKLPLSWQAKLFAVTAYLTTPFIISAIFYRGTIGEIIAYGLFPWLFWSIEQVVKHHEHKQKIWFSVICIWALFLLSHNVSVLFGTGIAFVYAIARFTKKKPMYLKFLQQFCWALCLSAWFWLPAYLEKPEVILDSASLQAGFAQHFPTIEQLLFSPTGFGFSYLGPVDSLSFSLGILGLLALLIIILFILASPKEYKQSPAVYILTGIATGLIFFQLSISEPIWRIIPLAQYIQFPWRLSLFFPTIMLVPIALIYNRMERKIHRIGFFLVLLFLIFRAHMTLPIETFTHTNEYYQSFTQSTSTANENLPKTFTFKKLDDLKKTPLLINRGNLEQYLDATKINVHYWTGSERTYSLNLTEETIVIEPTMYFLGWQSWNGAEQLTYVFTEESQGRIAFILPAGEHQISTRFTQNTPARRLGNVISLIALGFLTTALVRRYRIQKLYALSK